MIVQNMKDMKCLHYLPIISKLNLIIGHMFKLEKKLDNITYTSLLKLIFEKIILMAQTHIKRKGHKPS